MFEFLFKYSPTVFAKGDVVLLGRWPVWLLGVLVLAAAVGLAWPWWQRRRRGEPLARGLRPIGLWLLQTSLVSVLLLLLWHPAVSVATLRPQQNIVAVVVDDSRSMALKDDGTSRRDQVLQAIQPQFLRELRDKFQVRLYRLGERLERLDKPESLRADAPVTRLGDGLQQVVAEATSLPVGAVVLMSDGSDNAGGLDAEALNAIRRQRIPVHTVGFGRETLTRDLEVQDVQLPNRTLPESRVAATVVFRQVGYRGQKGRVTIKDGGKVLASQDVTFSADGERQVVTVPFSAGPAGAKVIQASFATLANEENPANNALTRVLTVEAARPRILYLEGEPRWEFKFIRRAAEEDGSLELVSMLRTTQNKIYRQGIRNPQELEQGFPIKAEELFTFQAVILGGVEANYLTQPQQELLRLFADRRGGGVLFLSGRGGLSEGGLGRSGLAEMLPVTLPDRKNTFRRDPATVELTAAGRDSLLCRLEDDPARNAERWKKLPLLANFQDVGAAKPGATVLAELLPTSKGKLPFLVVQRYGRGRTAVLGSGGTWRWQMSQDHKDRTHEMFWQQMLRWLVTETPGTVVTSIPKAVLEDEDRVALRVEVRDPSYQPVSDAQVQARVLGPSGQTELVAFTPDPLVEGAYQANWTAGPAGNYVVEVGAKRGEQVAGTDVLTFRKEVGVAENFRTEQNRELLQSLSATTGGKYYRPNELAKLRDDIAYSDAGLTVRQNMDLWDMPAVFLLLLLLRGSEWLLRRRWGAV